MCYQAPWAASKCADPMVEMGAKLIKESSLILDAIHGDPRAYTRQEFQSNSHNSSRWKEELLKHDLKLICSKIQWLEIIPIYFKPAEVGFGWDFE